MRMKEVTKIIIWGFEKPTDDGGKGRGSVLEGGGRVAVNLLMCDRGDAVLFHTTKATISIPL
jgi:hypothetical protein